jgi:glycosyltransferase involved in cell wall biosynthesis
LNSPASTRAGCPESAADAVGFGQLPEFCRDSAASLLAWGAVLPEAPTVSVVMTSFNSGAWLEPAIRSVLDQTWRPLELLLVDDGSEDESVGIALAIAAQDPRLRVFRTNRNLGTYRAKNLGIRSASGQVVTFMDSDDTCEPERIARQLDALREPGRVASTCNYVRRTPEGEIVMNRGLRERLALISLMVKREVIDDIGWFDGVRTSADYEYLQRLRLVYGMDAHVNVAEPLYLALHRDASLSTQDAAGTRMESLDDSEFLGEPRRQYVEAFTLWHGNLRAQGLRPFMPVSPGVRPFPAHPAIARD